MATFFLFIRKIEPHRHIENIALNYVIYVPMWFFILLKIEVYTNAIGSDVDTFLSVPL